MSGAYVGTDLIMSGDSTALKFAGEFLHFKPRTDHAVKNGNVYSTDFASPVFKDSFKFNTGMMGSFMELKHLMQLNRLINNP